MNRFRTTLITFALLLLALFLVFDFVILPMRSRGDQLVGRILVWHAWQNDERAALQEVFDRYRDLNPRVSVMVQAFDDPESMLAEYRQVTASGLGPDLLLGSSAWVPELATDHLIVPLDDQLTQEEWARYLPASVAAVSYQGRRYGIPESVYTMVLYYNKRLIEAPASTLSDLLEQAAAGQTVVMNPSFESAFWGVQAFGGRLFAADTGVMLDQGGFANWLAWLESARSAPGMILDSNQEALRTQFVEDGIAYYVGSGNELSVLLEQMGEDVLGVSPLPAGPNGSAGPLLRVRAFLLSSASSAAQQEIALSVARFVTNAEQSAALMRGALHVPANSTVQINPRLNPMISSMAVQARNAVPLPRRTELAAIWPRITEFYAQVLEGILEPAQAAAAVREAIAETMQEEDGSVAELQCNAVGTVRIADLLAPHRAQAMADLLSRFKQVCPFVITQHTQMSAADFQTMIADAPSAVTRFDLIIAPQEAMRTLIDEEQLKQISTDLFDTEFLARFRPISVEGLRYGQTLVGLPLALEVQALYYNTDQTDVPARALADFRNQTTDGLAMTLGVGFLESFWGIGGFGGRLQEEGAALLPTAQALVDWLDWLANAQEVADIQLAFDLDQARTQFVDGESAYYVGPAAELRGLQREMGDLVGVVPLPGGPAGNPSPAISVAGLFFPAAIGDAQWELAARLTRYLTSAESQVHLARMADSLPANAVADISDLTLLTPFLTYADNSVLLLNGANAAATIPAGNELYRAVLVDGVEPTEAVTRFVAEVTGQDVTLATPAPETEADQADTELEPAEEAPTPTASP